MAISSIPPFSIPEERGGWSREGSRLRIPAERAASTAPSAMSSLAQKIATRSGVRCPADPCCARRARSARRRRCTCKPTRFPGRQKPSQFRSVSEACRGLRTEFRPFSRILRLKSPASLCPQNSVSRTTRWRGRSGRYRERLASGGWHRRDAFQYGPLAQVEGFRVCRPLLE